MAVKIKGKGSVNIDVKSLSHESLVKVIAELKDSDYQGLRNSAMKELVARFRCKGAANAKIAKILVANEYGQAKKRLIANDWADALGITKEDFLRLIGMK